MRRRLVVLVTDDDADSRLAAAIQARDARYVEDDLAGDRIEILTTFPLPEGGGIEP